MTSETKVGGLVELPRETEFSDGAKNACCPVHYGYTADQMRQYATASVESATARLQAELCLRLRAVDRWVPCPDHRDKTEDGKCYVCENERLKKALSAHGQPVVDAQEAVTELAGYLNALNPECCNAWFPAAAARRCMETIAAALGATHE